MRLCRLCRLWDALGAQCQARKGRVRMMRQCSCRRGSHWLPTLADRDRLYGDRPRLALTDATLNVL
jgi:hypothetical protein